MKDAVTLQGIFAEVQRLLIWTESTLTAAQTLCLLMSQSSLPDFCNA